MGTFFLCFMACLTVRLYAINSGMKDGILYGRQGADSFKWNEHIIYVIERITFGFMFIIGCLLGRNNPQIFWVITMISINALLGFSLWHNGFYYVTRGKILNTHIGFTYNSSTSTSVIELRWRTRLGMEIFSWVLFICYFLYIYVSHK